MIWFIIIAVALMLLFYSNKKNKKLEIPRELTEKMVKLMFHDSSSDEDINYLTNKTFDLCLKNSNKHISITEIIDTTNLSNKPYLINYLGLYKSLRETIVEASKMTNIRVNSEYETSENTLKELVKFMISKINQINH